MNRRGFLKGLGLALVAAPAVIRIPGLLMPIRVHYPYRRGSFLALEDLASGEVAYASLSRNDDLFCEMSRLTFESINLGLIDGRWGPEARFIMSRDIRAALDQQSLRDRNVLLSLPFNHQGPFVDSFRGIPIEALT